MFLIVIYGKFYWKTVSIKIIESSMNCMTKGVLSVIVRSRLVFNRKTNRVQKEEIRGENTIGKEG